MLVFDLAFAKPSSFVRARHAAIELVDQGMHPTDLIAVAAYSSRYGLKVHLGFTDNRDQVRLAIASLGLPDVSRSYLQASALKCPLRRSPRASLPLSRGQSSDAVIAGGAVQRAMTLWPAGPEP